MSDPIEAAFRNTGYFDDVSQREFNEVVGRWKGGNVIFAEAHGEKHDAAYYKNNKKWYRGTDFDAEYREIPSNSIVFSRMANTTQSAASVLVCATLPIEVNRKKIETQFKRLLREANNFSRRAVRHTGFSAQLGQALPGDPNFFVPRSTAPIRTNPDGTAKKNWARDKWEKLVQQNYLNYGNAVSFAFAPLARLWFPSWVTKKRRMGKNTFVENGMICVDYATHTHIDSDGTSDAKGMGGMTFCGACGVTSPRPRTHSAFYLPERQVYISMDQNIAWCWFPAQEAHGTTASTGRRLPTLATGEVDLDSITAEHYNLKPYTITWGAWKKKSPSPLPGAPGGVRKSPSRKRRRKGK